MKDKDEELYAGSCSNDAFQYAGRDAVLNVDGDIVVNIKNDKPLKEQYDCLLNMIWFILGQVPAMADRTRIVVTNEGRSEEFIHVFETARLI